MQGINNYSGRTVPYTNFLIFQQSFSYDKANRLNYAEERNVTINQPAPYPLDWSRIFNYDGYGNMWVSAPNGIVPPGNTPSAASNFDPGTNRLTSYAGATYDPAGNQTANAGYQVSYDAENRQTAATTTSGPLASYSYDGSGNRVAITTQSGTSFYVYDALGQMAAAYTTTAPSLPCATCYLSSDHLGTVRVITDPSGAVIGRHDYLPFGEEIVGVPTGTTGRSDPTWAAADGIREKFTGKERDPETGLDYFGARYYGSSLGRFTSPDEPLADQQAGDPQSWNLYSYVRNKSA